MGTIQIKEERINGLYFKDRDRQMTKVQREDETDTVIIDYADWLASGVTITLSEWTADGVTLGATVDAGTVMTAIVTGTNGKVVNKVTTSQSEVHETEIRFVSPKTTIGTRRYQP